MKLVVYKLNQKISELDLSEELKQQDFYEVFIGRSVDCHLTIDDPLVSRHQVLLEKNHEGWFIENLSQLIEVRVNNVELNDKLKLSNNTKVLFAGYEVSVEGLANESLADHAESSQNLHDTSIVHESASSIMNEEVDIPTELMSEPSHSSPVEELEETEMISGEEESSPSEIRQNFEDHLDDQKDLSLSEDEVPSANIDEMNFGGEEDIIGSDVEGMGQDNSSFGSDQVDEFSNSETNEDFNENGFDDESDNFGGVDNDFGSSEDTEGTKILKNFANYELQLFGEDVPYDRYTLDQSEVYIGRDEGKCQIILNDSEVSSVHAVIKKHQSQLVLEDLSSSNGTLFNGQRINKVDLVNNDEFIIGSTTFTVKIYSSLIKDEEERLMPVADNQVIETEEIVEEIVEGEGSEGGIDFSGQVENQEKSVIKKIWKDPKKRRIAIILAVFLVVAFLLDAEEEVQNKATQETKKENPEKEKLEEKTVDLSDEDRRILEAKFKNAEAMVVANKLDEALIELEQIIAVDPNFNQVQSLYAIVKEKNQQLKDERERIKKEEEKARIKEEVKVLVEQAREAVDKKNVKLAESLFSQILSKDPENLDVSPLKLELQDYLDKKKADEEAIARQKAQRQGMIEELSPGKTFYLKKEWYKAILELEGFLRKSNMDEDLVKEASEMLSEAKRNLESELAPLLGKARSLKEGQDLKGAYETYQDVLELEPTNTEALKERNEIRETLKTRSKTVYREAIISESLSLFNDAKEKFQEVQQISPVDSEYYQKANEKLKDYVE